jgi:hypothetical protein
MCGPRLNHQMRNDPVRRFTEVSPALAWLGLLELRPLHRACRRTGRRSWQRDSQRYADVGLSRHLNADLERGHNLHSIASVIALSSCSR